MKPFVRMMLLVVMAGLLVAAFGCGTAEKKAPAAGEAAFAHFEDAAGRDITLDKKPERIVVTSASFLEPLHEVGGDVVGRPDSKTKMPDWAKDKTSVGKVYQIDAEKVLACNPDLVILNKGMNEKLAATLEDNGVKTVVLDMKSYDDVKQEVKILAQITGEKEKGDALLASMEHAIEAVRQRVPQEKKRIAIIHSTNQGLTIQLDGSIAGCAAKLLGWENVAAGLAPLEKNPDSAPYSLETLVEQNPDVLFITSMGDLKEIKAGMDKTMEENPAWQTIHAVKNGHVYYLPQDLFLLSPGIHYPDAVRTMASCIYPEAKEK
ncbi:MAG: ABC transporter substrate-binding protein [Mitsuokella sp.]